MHIPDGYVDVPTAAAAAAVALGGVALELRAKGGGDAERRLPLAGLAAAFVGTLQMLNFPVVAGTSGHVIGGALIAILLGPRLAILVMTVVISVQALAFADGGITALGLNVTNMALVTVVVGWLVFRGLISLLPRTAASIVAATAVASWISVVAASAAFALEYGVGGGGGVPFLTVLGAMSGVHALIGVGEGLVSAALVAVVLAARPDLVAGARVAGVTEASAVAIRRRPVLAFSLTGATIAVVLLALVAPHASSDPDGLERVTAEHGIDVTVEGAP